MMAKVKDYFEYFAKPERKPYTSVGVLFGFSSVVLRKKGLFVQ
jgi:hypothetical protein